MSAFDLELLQKDFPDLIPDPVAGMHGETVYRLKLPGFEPGREFEWVELRLPRGFPGEAVARIVLSPDAILRIPHVEKSGNLCILGDPGPASELSANDRLLTLLVAYQEQFLGPWQKGELDKDFHKESLNYWEIFCAQEKSSKDPVTDIWTVDSPSDYSQIREGVLLLPGRIVIAGDSSLPIAARVRHSLGKNVKQVHRVLIAEIPIDHPLTPLTWPKTDEDLDRLLQSHLAKRELDRFHTALHRRGRAPHRIILLRHQSYGYAYLLPGGPPARVGNGDHSKTYRSRSRFLPLPVTRFDPAWTVGRDAHDEVGSRQGKRVLVLGAGALGSPVVDHLARAGVGRITLVDDDILVPANIGRHLLGAESMLTKKADAIAKRVNLAYPSTEVTPSTVKAERWLRGNSLAVVDLVVDLTGESDVRWAVDQARSKDHCPCLIGWMEPFVVAAHVCCLPSGVPWLQGSGDLQKELEAVGWPDEVIRQEPGCSSHFQSYTAAAAAYAVAMITEYALSMLDIGWRDAQVISWVRGQRYLDKHWRGLSLRDWASSAVPHDGLMIERSYP